ncbi:MAG: hypothetical protein GQ477_00145 [Nanohaloarchaea archaeon]|nr:hypothetical protein [Candidatus Nanohaloarchaea archaeon]
MSNTVGAEILLEIKNVEKKAAKLEIDAEKKRETTLKKARDMASSWIDDAETEAEEISAKMLSDARMKIQEQKDCNLDISKKETSAFVKKSEKNIPEAVDHVTSAFLDKIRGNKA